MQATKLLLRNFAASLLLLGSISPGAGAWNSEITKPSLENFAALPSFTEPKLSPNGEQISYISAEKKRRVLVLEDLGGNNRVEINPQEKADILDHFWATDSRILVLYEEAQRNRSRGQINQRTRTRLAAVDRDGSNFIWVVKPETMKVTGSRSTRIPLKGPQIQGRILNMLADMPDHILLAVDGDRNRSAEIRQVNINTGDFKIVREDEKGVQNWFMDHHRTLRRGTGYYKSKWVDRIKDAAGVWRQVEDEPWSSKVTIRGFADDPNILYVSGYGGYGTEGLYTLALDSGTIVETIFAHPQVDIDELVADPHTNEPVGVSYTVDRQQVAYFNKTWANVQAALDKALPATNNLIVSNARDKDRYLVKAFSDKEPGTYYYFDAATNRLDLLAHAQPQIAATDAASVRPVQIPMRDGTTIPGYLTLPKGMKTGSNLPAVILPHGGPIARATANWEFLPQFLASHGYAVLEPNFRGSSGFGLKHLQAGLKQWGGQMQDDVTDATKWLVSEGIADRKRLCIVGMSYGGYSALMGAIKEPDLYQCAVSINGVTDVVALKKDDTQFIGGRNWAQRMGLEGVPDTDISPIYRADEIKAAILLIAAKDDTRVDYRLSKKMHETLSKQGKRSTFVELQSGGHNMDTGTSRLGLLQSLEPFLAKHLHK